MVMIGRPINPKFYICTDSDGCRVLHKEGFQPCYRFMGDIYFTKTNKIVEVIKKWNLKTK